MRQRPLSHSVLAVLNVLWALLGAFVTYFAYDDALLKYPLHGENYRIALSEAPHPALTVAITVAGIVTSALLVAAAAGLWRGRSWARPVSAAWIGLVLVEQVYLLVTRAGLDNVTAALLPYAFVGLTVYALISFVTVVRPPRTAPLPASLPVPTT